MSGSFNYILHLGGNAGSRMQYLSSAKNELKKNLGPIDKQSRIYETTAWGPVSQEPFLNQAVQGRTNISPFALLKYCKAIEKELGRVKRERWGPREIDIDIIFFESFIVGSSELILPHPLLHQRRFVLRPLMDIIPEFTHPVLQAHISELLENCKDEGKVEIFTETAGLRD